MPREINAAGYRLIKEFEAGPQGNSQPAQVPYRCPAGRWTNGWGNTYGVTANTPPITRARAEADLERNLDWAEDRVDRTCPGANGNEFAAMVSLCFNIGPEGFAGSTAARLFNKGDKAGSAAAFALWRKFQDPRTGRLVDSPGLIRRRSVEQALFLTPAEGVAAVPAVVAPLPNLPGELMPQAVAPERSAASSKTVIAGGVAVATGAASVVDQVSQLAPTLETINEVGLSLQSFLKLGAPVLSVIALAAAAFFLWRYIAKKRRGEVMST
jgi:lysozyme